MCEFTGKTLPSTIPEFIHEQLRDTYSFISILEILTWMISNEKS